jgi:hypothetical protein
VVFQNVIAFLKQRESATQADIPHNAPNHSVCGKKLPMFEETPSPCHTEPNYYSPFAIEKLYYRELYLMIFSAPPVGFITQPALYQRLVD